MFPNLQAQDVLQLLQQALFTQSAVKHNHSIWLFLETVT